MLQSAAGVGYYVVGLTVRHTVHCSTSSLITA